MPARIFEQRRYGAKRRVIPYFVTSITPTYGAELISDPGLEGVYTGGLCAGLSNQNGGPSQSADVHSGAKAQQSQISAQYGFIRKQTIPVTIGTWYRFAEWAKRTAGATNDNVPNFYALTTQYVYTPPITEANWTLKEGRFHALASNNGELRISSSGAAAGWDTVIVDDISVKAINFPSMLAKLKTSASGDTCIGVKLTPIACVHGGLILNLDSAINPQNYVIAYLEKVNSGLTYLHIDKCVGGTVAVILGGVTNPVTIAAGAELEIKKTGTTYKVYYNRALVTSQTINEGTINNNTLHGQFANSDRIIFTGMRVKNLKNIFPIGDSRTAGTIEQMYVPMVFGTFENCARFATTGWKIANVKAGIDAKLAGLAATPDYVLINMGVNDATGVPMTSEADFKADYAYVLDAIHTKWSGAKIYLARVWNRAKKTECATVNGWLAQIAAGRTDTFLGPDESVTIENGDDGAAYTTDGLHYNAAGTKVWATAWETSLGIPLCQ